MDFTGVYTYNPVDGVMLLRITISNDLDAYNDVLDLLEEKLGTLYLLEGNPQDGFLSEISQEEGVIFENGLTGFEEVENGEETSE